MNIISESEAPPIIRTDFSDDSAWESLLDTVRRPAAPFVFNMEVINDHANDGAGVEKLLASIPQDYTHAFIVVADKTAISDSDHPLLIVDLLEERGRHFRAIATEVPSIENNLAIGNMDFQEFEDMTDDTGTFRGFPEM